MVKAIFSIVLTIQKYVFLFQSHSESFYNLWKSRWKYLTPVPIYLLYLFARLGVPTGFLHLTLPRLGELNLSWAILSRGRQAGFPTEKLQNYKENVAEKRYSEA